MAAGFRTTFFTFLSFASDYIMQPYSDTGTGNVEYDLIVCLIRSIFLKWKGYFF